MEYVKADQYSKEKLIIHTHFRLPTAYLRPQYIKDGYQEFRSDEHTTYEKVPDVYLAMFAADGITLVHCEDGHKLVLEKGEMFSWKEVLETVLNILGEHLVPRPTLVEIKEPAEEKQEE
ncbi:MAG: hypothetical protein PHS95_02095 [Candidatus Pacebacteria bacterium]|nr:hypothetical protein [Candidatus Paceibacterota bacterium]